MKRIRVIPVLLIQKGGLVKSVRFKNYQYIGDPINTVKIFNDKEVDEIVILDISATGERRPPDMQLVRDLAGEAFMPLAYGGGITSVEQVKELIYNGVEKIIINSAAFATPNLIQQAAKWAGSQSVVVSVDTKKNTWGTYKVYTQNATINQGIHPVEFVKRMESEGAGELLLQDISRDGTFSGYALDLINEISGAVKIPVVACSGAASLPDFAGAVKAGAAAVAAGSMFVLQRPHRAVLINYPSQQELQSQVFSHFN